MKRFFSIIILKLTITGAAYAALYGDYTSYSTMVNYISSTKGKTGVLTVQYIHASKNRHIFVTTGGQSLFLYGVPKKIKFSGEKTYRVKFKITGKVGVSLKANYIAYEVAK